MTRFPYTHASSLPRRYVRPRKTVTPDSFSFPSCEEDEEDRKNTLQSSFGIPGTKIGLMATSK
jgi:hypothetical protein